MAVHNSISSSKIAVTAVLGSSVLKLLFYYIFLAKNLQQTSLNITQCVFNEVEMSHIHVRFFSFVILVLLNYFADSNLTANEFKQTRTTTSTQ